MRTLKQFKPLLIASLASSAHGFGMPGIHASGILDTGSLQHMAFATTNNLFDSYQTSLREHPLNTQVTTGVFLAIVGDAIAQYTNKIPYNVKRAVSFAAFDGLYRVAQHYIYPPMILACQGNVLKAVMMDQNLAAATEQALVSQLCIIPLVYYPCFFALTGVVQGLSVSETIERARDGFWSLMTRNWLYWIPVQGAVFAFINDESLQISVLIACGLVWTVILSLIAGAATPMEEPLELPEEAMRNLEITKLSQVIAVVAEAEEVPTALAEMQPLNATRT